MGQLTRLDHRSGAATPRSASREYLTDAEVDRLISAAGENRNGHRDATMVLVAYRHGLRAGELVTLRWDAIDFAHGRLHVQPAQGQRGVGPPAVRPRAAGAAPAQARAGPGFAVHLHVRTRCAVHDGGISQDGRPARCGRSTSTFRCIRTCCGTPAAYKLANDGVDTRSLQAYLGHKNIQHTVRYTELAPTRFKNFWRD